MIVPAPTRMASWVLRRRWTNFREDGELTQRESPVTEAILPSIVWANLRVAKGTPVVMNLKNRSFMARHDPSMIPIVVLMPARFKASTPRPATRGLGATAPITTRAGFTLISDSTQGGVLP